LQVPMRKLQVPMRELQVPMQATTSLPTELTDVASEDRCADDRRESILPCSCSGIMTKPGAGVSDRRGINVPRLKIEETENFRGMRATRERRGGSAGGPGPRGPREGHQGAGDRPQRPLPEPRRGAPSGRRAAARQVLSRAPPPFGKVAWVGRPALGVRLMAASGGRAGLPTGGPTGCLAIGPAARPPWGGAAARQVLFPRASPFWEGGVDRTLDAGRMPYGCAGCPSRTAHKRSDRVFGY